MTERVLILGGGTAGWITALALARRARPGRPLAVTLVDSAAIGSIGVGEATVPAILDYLTSVQADVPALIRDSRATLKAGIAFQDWRAVGQRYFHGFGLYGASAGDVGFHQVLAWLQAQDGGQNLRLEDFNLCAQMALRGRFAAPPAQPQADHDIYRWALHLDAGLFAQHLRRQALGSGVQHLDGVFEHAAIDPDSGALTAITLTDGRRLEADLFIDCSGFRGLLIRQALQQPWVSWRHWLPCDRAVAQPTAGTGPATPYTLAQAQPAGWRWRIPLQHRIGNGHVYASTFMSDEQALQLLQGHQDGEALAEPNWIRFDPGHIAQPWVKNVVAIGLSAGFLEPLESTGITLIHSAIDKLLALWPEGPLAPALAAEFNRASLLEMERIRDFLVLHYALSERRDSEFWRHVTAAPLPDTLAHKLAVYRANGHFVRHEWETFQDHSWLAVYDGLGVRPLQLDARLARFRAADVRRSCEAMQADIQRRAEQAPLPDAETLGRALQATP
jgi:tryptophan 7-halogenase